jgi:hypothetical protein
VPYANTLTLIETEGGGAATLDATARIWMIWTDTAGDRQQEEGSVDFTAAIGSASSFSFPGPASFASVSRDVGLSIQATTGVSDDTGWLFRSGRSPTTLLTPPIEVVGGALTVPQSDIDARIAASVSPTDPMKVDDKTSISTVAATLGSGVLDLSASGGTSMTGSPIGFTFTGKLSISPSWDQALPTERALAFAIASPAISFGGGATIGAAIEAALLNAVGGVIAVRVVPAILAQLETQMAAGVASAAGKNLPGGVLPAGVILSIRSVQIRPAGDSRAGINIRAALGAFGGVLSKFPQPGGNGGSKCALQTLQTLGHAMASMGTLRTTRDGLLGTAGGRRLVARYYEVAPEAAAILEGRPDLAARAAEAATAAAAALQAGRPLGPALLRRCEALVRELAALGSPSLRAAAEEAVVVARTAAD